MNTWLLANAPSFAPGDGGSSGGGMDVNPGTYWSVVVVIGLMLWIRELMK